MDPVAKQVIPIRIEDEMRNSYMDYSMSVIIGRALPDVRDGLKPVHRRILYAMDREGLHAGKKYSKCAGVVGEVLKKYHPHGDSAVYDALVRMAQPWNLRYPLVDGQGNFGSVDGDPAAAYRYTECRMTKLAEELLVDIDKETVSFSPNFDGATEEPDVLPAAFPNLLVNGADGIAVGMATKIPPHNLGEIIDACTALIADPSLSLEELMQIVPGPDFPTGATIYGRTGIREAYSTGRGRIIVRGEAEIEELSNGRNAIVITEGMVIGMARGKSAEDAAAETESSTSIPLLGATVIGIMAFSGIGLSPDATGEFLFSLFAVIAISLLSSWVLAVTVTPYLGKLLLKAPKNTSDDPYKGPFYGIYRGVLWTALRARIPVVLTIIGITVWSVMAFAQVKQAFFPASNTPIFYVEFQMPQGTDINTTDEEMLRLERILLDEDAVTGVTALVGRGASRFMLTYNPEQADASYGQLIVRVADAATIPAIASRLNRDLPAEFPHALIRVEEIVFGPPAGADVAVRFSGPDPVVLRQLADDAIRIYEEAGTITNPRTNWRQREILVEPVVDEARMRLAGATRGAIADTIRYGTSGLRVGDLREDDVLIPIQLRLPENERDGVDRLRDLSVWSDGAGAYVPMANLVERFDPRLVEALIHRRDRERTIAALGGARSDLTADEAFRSVRTEIESIPLPDGYAMEWGGEFESAQMAQESLGKQLPLGFLVMLTISILMFNKVRQPLILWLVVPMSVTGMVLGLLFTGLPFTFTALLGFLSLSGMLMKNAIVLIEEIDFLRAQGVPDYKAVIDGSVSRLRPVVLAAGTTIFGMIPLLPDAFFASMAVTIMGGLAFASVLTLVAVPVLYALLFRIRPSGAKSQEVAPIQA